MIKELNDAVKWHKDKNYIINPMLADNKEDSIWYSDLVFSFDYKGYCFSVHAFGDIEFDYKGETYYSIYETDITNDEQLHNAIQNGELEFYNNNWYELFIDKVDEQGKPIEEISNIVIDNITDCVDKDWVESLIKGE